MTKANVATKGSNSDAELSLFRLLDPDVLADPYPLFHQLLREDPVHWDPFLHCWVVTRYWDVIRVLRDFSAQCTPSSEHLTTIGLSALNPVAKVMVRQMLFLDPPAHTRIRSLAAAAFTPQRVEVLRSHIRDVVQGQAERAHGRDRRFGRAAAIHRHRRDARFAGCRSSPIEIVVTGLRRSIGKLSAQSRPSLEASEDHGRDDGIFSFRDAQGEFEAGQSDQFAHECGDCGRSADGRRSDR